MREGERTYSQSISFTLLLGATKVTSFIMHRGRYVTKGRELCSLAFVDTTPLALGVIIAEREERERILIRRRRKAPGIIP